MSTVFEVPLVAATPQTLSVTVLGTTYGLSLVWNDQELQDGTAGTWEISIAASDGTPLVNSIPLVPGIDLLEQYGYLDFGFQLFAQSDNDANAVPQWATLGVSDHLYVVTP